jgi:hypothetical protein
MQSELAFRGMSDEVEQRATPKNSLQSAVIAGADHVYTACHDALAARVAAWLRKLPGDIGPTA